ncbi:hypothetical protein HPB50_001992 [Hyalomma asiaticum]|uniref:Uncharacterized protein n=1 Tax=Hyalomma asiaticum TaxID=266040 RepID=A0ACB7RZX0_HYAAI|nr:hypothetical protein HPB50_001992 [Hyalomma asiaticum]
MPQSAVSTTVHEVQEAIISVAALKKLLHFSRTPAAKQRAKAAFFRRGCFPGVLACVDGTLVAARPQPGGHGKLHDPEGVCERHGRNSGYLLETWLLTPIPGNLAPGTPECEYNKEHTSMRNVVGRCIGVLKSRFRCLQRYRALLYKPD